MKNALGSTSDSALSGALDELYGARFESFMSLRGELAGRLRAAGDASAARQIANAPKPTRTAWALNQVARRRPELLAAIVSTREAAAGARKSGDSSEIRDGARRYRDAVGEAVRAVGSILAADGVPFSAAQARRVGETLQVLATDEAERARLTAGRLVRDVAVEDPFAGIEAGPPARRPSASQSAQSERTATQSERAVRGEKSEKAASVAKAKGRPDDELARAREAKRIRDERARAIDEARARVKALEASNAEARRAAAEAHRELLRTQREADKAKRALAEVEQELESARAHLAKLPK